MLDHAINYKQTNKQKTVHLSRVVIYLRGKEYRLKLKNKTVSRLYLGKAKPDNYCSHPLKNSKGLKPQTI